MEALFDVNNIIITYGYAGVILIVFLESGIFFPLPGDSLIFTAGLLASSLGFNIWLLVCLLIIATFSGGMAGYYIGTRLEYLYKYKFFQKIFKGEHMNQASIFFEKHGFYAIILSRFVPIVRTFLPIVAGMVRMNLKSFIRFSLISSVIWSGSLTLGGYFLGRAFPQIENYLGIIIIVIVIFSVIPGIYHWWRGKKNRTT